MRGFTWRTKQQHRPGLEFLVSTGRKHGFESLEERAALLALEGVGRAVVTVRDEALVAYVVAASAAAGETGRELSPGETGRELSPAGLRAALAARLPAHLVPNS
nr:hypothetical protein [Streptomyces sp. DSM 41633]